MAYLEKISRKKLGEILIEQGLCTRQQIQDALDRQKQTGELLGEVLVSEGIVSERDLAGSLCTQFQKPFINANYYNVSREVVHLLPPQMLIEYLFIPLDRFDDILVVCMAGMLTQEVLEAVSEQTGCKVEVYIGTLADVKKALAAHFPDYFDPITMEPQFDRTISSAVMAQQGDSPFIDATPGTTFPVNDFSDTDELQELVEEDYDWEALFEEAEKEVMKEIQNRRKQG